jgi:hypothetical protein
VNSELPVPVPVSEFVTTMLTTPATRAPVVHESEVGEVTDTAEHDTPPTDTVAPNAKPVPVRVIRVPPEVGPEVGVTPETVGDTTATLKYAVQRVWTSGTTVVVALDVESGT